METVEILAGGEFANAVKSLGLTSAVCTYHYQPQPTHWREEYQVWLLSKEDFDNICAIDNDDWKCVKSSIIRTKNYQIGWEANENAGNFDN